MVSVMPRVCYTRLIHDSCSLKYADVNKSHATTIGDFITFELLDEAAALRCFHRNCVCVHGPAGRGL